MDWGSEAEAKIVDFLEAVRASGLHFSYVFRRAESLNAAPSSEEQKTPAKPGTITISPRLCVELSGLDAARMTERGGELLHALESMAVSILRLAPDEQDELCFDALAFKEERRQALERLAQSAIGSVNSSGQPFAFAPMNSRERRMLHLALASCGLPTASSGEGPRRFVVLYPPGAKPTPQRFDLPIPRRPVSWANNRQRSGSPRPAAAATKAPVQETLPAKRLDPNGHPLESESTTEAVPLSEQDRLDSLRRAFRKR